MNSQEINALSAAACSQDELNNAGLWSPFTNAEQRWACVEKLLEMGWQVEFYPPPSTVHACKDYISREHHGENCPASEFPARALAELWRRSQ